MLRIALCNEKGGTGKTTLAYHIAAVAAMRGQRVLLVDADPQGGSLSTQLGLVNKPGLYNVLVRGEDLADHMFRIARDSYSDPASAANGSLFVLPGNSETRLIQNSDNYSRFVLFDMTEEAVEIGIDLMLIDTNPTPSEFHNAVYMVADAVFIPTQCEPMGVAGLYSTLAHIQRANQALRGKANLPPLRMAGVLPNLYRTRVSVHEFHLAEMQRTLGATGVPLLPYNAQRVTWSEASMAGQTVFAYEPRSDAAASALAIAEAVLREVAHV